METLTGKLPFDLKPRKDAVNRGGAKIGADELPAVTQLFTEPYMVGFLLRNTLGAWRAGRLLAARPDLAEAAPDEARYGGRRAWRSRAATTSLGCASSARRPEAGSRVSRGRKD